MLFDRPEIRELLCQIVWNVTHDGALFEDLMQEALIHLWQQELRCSGQTQSWYLQSCRFYLLNYVNHGRSLDALKRCHARFPANGRSELTHAPESEGPEESVATFINAQDIIQTLGRSLKPSDRVILDYLADGYGIREIAHTLKISHQAVSKQRRKIAALAVKLGILPMPKRA